jgi:hypothetical protein
MIGYHSIQKSLIDTRLKIHYEIGKTYELPFRSDSNITMNIKTDNITDNKSDNKIEIKPENETTIKPPDNLDSKSTSKNPSDISSDMSSESVIYFDLRNTSFRFHEMPYDEDRHFFGSVYLVWEILGDVYYEKNGTDVELYTNKVKVVDIIHKKHIAKRIPDGEFKTVYGDIFYFRKGVYHRENDEPAIIRCNGSEKIRKEWKRSIEFFPTIHRKPHPQLKPDDGTTHREWYIKGKLHRENDQPAIIHRNGDSSWYYDGVLHREKDKPAIVDINGSKEWYYEGKRHRSNDKPASIDEDGNMKWYKHAMQHRDYDRPAVVDVNGNLEWYINGIRRRIDQSDDCPPTIINQYGDQIWLTLKHKYDNDKYRNFIPSMYDFMIGVEKMYDVHRMNDQPAIIRGNGDREWYNCGRLYHQDGGPTIIRANGDKEWRISTSKHSHNPRHEFERKSVIHREFNESKPAIIKVNGDKYWYIKGRIARKDDKPPIILHNGIEIWYSDKNIKKQKKKNPWDSTIKNHIATDVTKNVSIIAENHKNGSDKKIPINKSIESSDTESSDTTESLKKNKSKWMTKSSDTDSTDSLTTKSTKTSIKSTSRWVYKESDRYSSDSDTSDKKSKASSNVYTSDTNSDYFDDSNIIFFPKEE